MITNKLTLCDYVEGGYSAIVYKTSEEKQAVNECLRIANQTGSDFWCWSATKGIHDKYALQQNGKAEFPYSSEEPSEVLLHGLRKQKKSPVIYCLLDFHHYLRNPNTIRTAKDVFNIAKEKAVTYIFISESFEVPEDLKHEMFVLDRDLPSRSDFEILINKTLEANGQSKAVSEEDVKKVSDALSGLNMQEAENALAISLLKTGELDLEIIYDIKKRTICNEDLLEYYNSNETIDNVGGMKAFKDYAAERSFSVFSDEAREYGLPYPKGVLLFGVPGCGKSLAAKALANMWQVSLLKVDLGKLFASFVGETESNTRKALKMAESMAPCILWMDEVDKAISGVSSSGKTDSGVTSRMFGSILTWLQEKKAPVYVIATANNINLPPEFLRRGRFDEIFFVDLPNLEERKEIWKIQLVKHKRKAEAYDVDKLAEKSEGYNGAEIEECIVSAMYHAWSDGKRDFTTEDVENALNVMKPASQGIAKETIEALRNWSQEHGIRNASENAETYEASDIFDNVSSSRRVRRPVM